jgi:hypothetical protein
MREAALAFPMGYPSPVADCSPVHHGNISLIYLITVETKIRACRVRKCCFSKAKAITLQINFKPRFRGAEDGGDGKRRNDH